MHIVFHSAGALAIVPYPLGRSSQVSAVKKARHHIVLYREHSNIPRWCGVPRLVLSSQLSAMKISHHCRILYTEHSNIPRQWGTL